MMTMSNDTSAKTPLVGINQFPESCHKAIRRIQDFVHDYSPKHVVCLGPIHPWTYAVVSMMKGGRVDSIYQTDEMTDGDMVVIQDMLLTNIRANETYKALNQVQNDLEIHVRHLDEDLALHDETFRWGRADTLVYSQHLKTGVPFHEKFKTRRTDWTFDNVLCLIPHTPANGVDEVKSWCALDEAEAMDALGYEEVLFLPARENQFGLIHFQPTQR
jgi:hypothetical protein